MLDVIGQNYLLYGILSQRYNALLNTVDVQNQQCQSLWEKLNHAK